MKTYGKNGILGLLLAGTMFVGATGAFAYYQSSNYSHQYYNIPTYSSYTYMDGCNTYRYDPYTRTSTFLYTTCQTYNYSYPYDNTTYYNYQNYHPYNSCDTGYYYPYNYDICYNYSTSYIPAPMIDWFPYYGGSYSSQTHSQYDTCNSYYGGCYW